LIAVVAALAVMGAQTTSSAASTVLTIFTGTTSVAHGNSDYVSATDGEILRPGDRVRTDAGAHALVTFFDGSTLELEPSTTVQIDAAAMAGNGSITIQLSQAIGRTWASVQRLTRSDSKFDIKTPSSTASVRGTAFLTEVFPNGETRVHTTEGTVAVTAQGTTVLVTAGFITSVQRDGPPSTPRRADSPANLLRFGMHSPAHVVIVDPLGRSCGIATPSERIVREIPGCDVSAPGSEPELIDVPNAITGLYRAVITSIEPGGAFTFSSTGVDGDGNVTFDFARAGDGRPGTVFGSALDVTVAPNGALTTGGLSELAVLQGPPTSPAPSVAPPSSPDTLANASPAPSIVPNLPLPTLPVGTPTAPRTATPDPTPSSTPAVGPAPTSEASSTAAPSATASPTPTVTTSSSPTTSPSPAPPATVTSPPSLTASPTASTSPTTKPSANPTERPTSPPATRTPVPGCDPSNQRPNTCVP
jgi:hypothetical protein